MSIKNTLEAFALEANTVKITDMFGSGDRAKTFSTQFDGLLFDYAKTTLREDTLAALIQLAEEAQVAQRRDAMFAGEKINETEGRAVLHTALRRSGTGVFVDGEDVMPGIHATLDRMEAFAN